MSAFLLCRKDDHKQLYLTLKQYIGLRNAVNERSLETNCDLS